ncbi:MAG: hypothetical protein CMP91_10490 [Gammaproteobacteria bacterium]|nr:hypothetical protein [Gammaproteobacteria bacterium]MAY01351.1 hypothetical protein [Gammaproteobacteria bacterium]|tara:strand:+ start:1364 stop:1663 length:300 start_codon:yes stop_codon:yes gene_type:complete
MISTLISFQYSDNFDAGKIASIAETARSKFEGFPGLRSKAFTIDHDNKRALNFYVWESEEAARNFFTDEQKTFISGLYGADIQVQYLELKQLVDNASSE